MISYRTQINYSAETYFEYSQESIDGFIESSPLLASLRDLEFDIDLNLNFKTIDIRHLVYNEKIADHKSKKLEAHEYQFSNEAAERISEKIVLEDTDQIIIIDFSWEFISYDFCNTLLDALSKKCNVDNVFFITSNSPQYSKNNYYCDHFFEKISFDKVKTNYNNSKREKRFICLNRKPRNSRLKFIDLLYKNNLQKDILLSHPAFNEYQESIVDVDLHNFEIDLVEELDIPIVNYGLKVEEKFLKNADIYKKAYWNIVTETLPEYQKSSLFITEKTFKPIMSKMPFIIFGPPFILKELKNLGYKTFDQYIDESYDNETDTNLRISKIINIIKNLSDMDEKSFQIMYKDLQNIVEFNYNHFVERNKNRSIGYNFIKSLLNKK